MDNEKVKERVNLLIEKKGLTRSIFSKVTGVNNLYRKLDSTFKFTVNDINRISVAMNVPKEWLTGETDDYSEYNSGEIASIPVYDSFPENNYAQPLYKVAFPAIGDCTLICRSNTTVDKVRVGDLVALKLIEDTSFLADNEIYMVELCNGMSMIRRIVNEEGERLALLSDNQDAPRQSISKASVRRIYKVRAVISII